MRKPDSSCFEIRSFSLFLIVLDSSNRALKIRTRTKRVNSVARSARARGHNPRSENTRCHHRGQRRALRPTSARNLDPRTHEIHVVLSNYAQQVIAEELPGGLRLPDGVKTHNIKSMNAPFASGSNPPDAMVVIPCTMGTMGRIAHGYSEDVLLRAADVVLKERKKLILVPRETPLSLVHVKNMELLLLAGAVILPANPSFYAGPKTIQEVVDTVVARVLDHLGVPKKLAPRWREEKE